MEDNQYEHSGMQPEQDNPAAMESVSSHMPAQEQPAPQQPEGQSGDQNRQSYGQGYQSPYQNQQSYGQGYQSSYQNQQPYGQGYQGAYQNQQPYGQGYQNPYQNQQPYGQYARQGYAQGYYGTPPQPVPEPARPEPSPARINRALLITAIVAFAAILGFSVYCMVRDLSRGALGSGGNTGVQITIGTQKKPEVAENYQDETGRYTVEGIAQAVRPSIVEIYTYGKVDSLVIGSGSGIIISEDGYIVTNEHVLEGATSYVVYLDDDSTYPAKLVGRDAKTDIAVLKIDAAELTVAVLGDSDETVLGEEVVAIGNPAGLSGTLTNGIVSGLNRKIRSDSTGYEMTCIQTNAAISPGNSGGALVNMFGQVVGITSSKYVSSSYEGLGFAITINEALPIIEELIQNGYISGRYRIGISFYSSGDTRTQRLFEQEQGFEIPEDFQGIWIDEISGDCSVASTELRKGDFIYKVGGKEVYDYDSLSAALEGCGPGDTVTAQCRRYGSSQSDYKDFDISFELMEDRSGDY
ncbi:trypsin-like peptidase domain-containing protein [Ruminococcus sp.]|uniref:S1C family serine protease n=1 Tax=Ruminococcus sp. TaxID=41978 RepID=UPI003F0881FF